MANSAKSMPEFRLPGDLSPLHYDLDIITNLEDDYNFEGKVEIKIKCLTPTDTIKTHARNLSIESNKVLVKSLQDQAKPLEVVNTLIDSENEFYIMKTLQPLVAGQEYSLHIPFRGKLEENLVGYYRSRYFDRSSNVYRYLAVTHFEPSNARQAFPCFDEPGMKATFTIRLGHANNLHAVSNMPLKSTTPIDDRPNYTWSEFEKTVPMSTYLIAYMVSDFGFKNSNQLVESESNITFTVWARTEALEQATFPAHVGPHFLTFYEDFFGVKYPLPKLDVLAIPDFKIGAMENWGLITFRESLLLLDEKTTSSSTKLHIASIIAHELAHMWFGNLVTMWWWTDLWLKEGFATYMAGLAVHHEFPEWNSLDAEALSDLLRVFNLDALKNSHPVSVPIGHSKEISQIFDAISYDKGSFLLRMMSLFLGEEVFRHGLSEYLKKHQFGNAEQDDMWASLTEQAHRYSVLPADLTVKDIMDTWTLQTGYPIITVTRDYKNNKVTVSQKRYLANKLEKESDYGGSWWVPLTCSSAQKPDFNRTLPQQWLARGEETTVVDIRASSDEWIIFNIRAAGLYKVNYDSQNWKLLIGALNSEKFEDINVMNRALLIVDSMDFAYSGVIDYDIALRLIKFVKRETSFVCWSAVLSKLESVKSKLFRTTVYGHFKRFMQTLLIPIVESLVPWKEELDSFEKGRLMNLISQTAVELNIETVDSQASSLFQKWFKSNDPDVNNPIPKDVRRAVYSHAVAVGGEAAWNFLWERYKNANVVAEQNNILIALTNSKEVWLINRYLEWSLSEQSGVRKQDAFVIFRATASKDLGFHLALRFFYNNIERISKYFGANSNLIGYYFSAVAGQMVSRYEYDELKTFSEKYKDLLAPASLSVQQALESVELNIHWMEKHYSSIHAPLELLSDL